MEKETLLSTITERLGETPLSQRTISDYIDQNLPAEGTEPDDAYWTRHVNVLKSLAGNYRSDLAAGIEGFKRTFKPSTTPPGNPQENGDTELLKRIEQLEQMQKESARTAASSALRTEVIAKGESLKVANKAIWEDAVKTVQIGDGETSETLIEKAKSAYEKMLKRYVGEGAAPYGNSGRQGASKEAEQEMAARREAFKETQRKAGRLPKKQ